ncbi:MAG: DUF86 domain-containing protein [Dehalococcoidia bacterium]|nr:DUF86 domain-containing protein [Dehalococcoidia bacterium]
MSDVHTRRGDLIEEFVGARAFSEYERNAMLRSAVERQFINIGESVNLLSRAAPGAVSWIADYPDIISFRNTLVHEFFEVNHSTVWDIVKNHLPILRAEVVELMQEYER